MQRLSLPPVDQIASFLGQVSLLRAVKGEPLKLLAEQLELLTYQKDEVVYAQGEVGDALYIIRTGAVGVFIVDPMVGLQYEVARLRTGQSFGEMAVLTDERHSTTCKSVDRTACLKLSRKSFQSIVAKSPEVAMAVAQELAERLNEFQRERTATMVDLSKFTDPDLYRLVPKRILEQHKMIPLSKKDGVLTVACVNVGDLAGLDELRRVLRGMEIRTVSVREAEYQTFLSKYAMQISGPVAPRKPLRVQSIQWHTPTEEEKAAGQADARGEEVKQLVDRIIAEGVEKDASDIHIEPERDGVSVRYRVSGKLVKRQAEPIARGWHRAIVSRIKVLAELDISERRRPQDGRISCGAADRTLDIRLSTMPTHDGEKVVLRLLDSAKAMQPLETLILAEKVARVVHKMVSRPYGVIYVCGPTGSGKTTTLYSALGILRGEQVNITTVEDPIEYRIPGITQVNVKPEIGLSFATMLRSILRQDPNVILVGETRDSETGQLVVEAGLTGHLVLTSLHTNDAIGAIQRLREMGLENFAIATSMIGVVSQRLVRRLCPACSQEAPLPAHVLEQLVLAEVLPRDWDAPVRTAKGCEECEGTGYMGRVGAYEILVADDELKQQMMDNATQFELRATALKGAYVPIARYSNYLLSTGVTSASEVLGILVTK